MVVFALFGIDVRNGFIERHTMCTGIQVIDYWVSNKVVTSCSAEFNFLEFCSLSKLLCHRQQTLEILRRSPSPPSGSHSGEAGGGGGEGVSGKRAVHVFPALVNDFSNTL